MVTDKGYDYGKNVRETIFDKGVNEATCPKCGFIGGFIEFTNPDNASRIKKGRSMINIHEEQFTKQCALNEVLIDLILCAKEDGLSFREAVENAWRPDKE